MARSMADIVYFAALTHITAENGSEWLTMKQ